jgi:hypothetical protein
MSDSENFLARWSRRKRDIEQSEAEKLETPADESTSDSAPQAPGAGATTDSAGETAAEAENFDPANLPPLESITAETDIRAYFARGVPAELARAALRRAWASDPAIRDFVGLAENAWDFNAPETIPGFGPITASDDVAGMMRQLMGEGPPAEPAGTSPPQTMSAQAPEIPETLPDQQVAFAGRGPDGEPPSEQPLGEKPGEPDEPGAPNSEMPATETEPAANPDVPALPARGHGGALPR